MLLKYNLIAAAGAIIGMLNTILTWKLFGATQSADVWLLGLAVVSILGLLVLMGVEQFLVFYTGILTQQPNDAGGFAATSAMWALISGGLFALGCFAAADHVISLFAGGLSTETRQSAASVLVLLLPQVAVAPLLHVSRGVLNAHGKYGLAYLLTLVVPSALMFALLFFTVSGGGDVLQLGWVAAAAAGLQMGMCLVAVYKWCQPGNAMLTKEFRDFVVNSVTMRIGHSFHNFFVGLIINNALSHQATGMISIFQYAKRFADGVFTVTIGPHVSILLARQASAWSERNHVQHRQNMKEYLRTVMPLFLAASLVALLLMPLLLHTMSRNDVEPAIEAIQITYAIFTVWQGIIALEAVFVGVVTTARQSMIMWGVNALFIGSFYFYTNLIPQSSPVWYLVAAAILAQMMSTGCFALSARALAKRRFIKAAGRA
ncbi:MAG TPA: lipid II flippase MurJ [Gallionella sp.]